MKVTEFDQGPDDRIMIPCTCGETGHFIVFTADVETFRNEDEVWLEVGDFWRTPRGIPGRIRAAFSLFFKGEYCRGEAELNRKTLTQVRDWCQKYLDMGS